MQQNEAEHLSYTRHKNNSEYIKELNASKT